jgi:4-hydroxybenzoate polyprenyltransferase
MRVKSIPPTFLLCFSGGWIMNPSLPNLLKSVTFIVSTINTLLIMSASMVINDICDIEIDRINSPHRPLVNGEVTMKEAYVLSLLLLGVSEYLTFKFLPFNLQMIIQLVIFQIILYTPVLKRIFLIKNLSCAGLVSFSIFFNGLAAAGNTLLSTNKNFGLLSITLSLIFFGSWSNELLLDMRDIEGDKNNKIVTLPTLFGNDVSWLLTSTIIHFNMISNSLSMAYLYNSPGIGSGIVVILTPLLVNLYKIKKAEYSLESIKNYAQKSNYPLFVLILYLCGLAFTYT